MKFVTTVTAHESNVIKVLKDGNYKIGHIRRLGREYLFFPFAHAGALNRDQLQAVARKLRKLNSQIKPKEPQG